MTGPAARGVFVIPGDLAARTGGYGYDREILARLPLRHVALTGAYPFPTAADLEAADALFGALPDATVTLVDGLAFGVLDRIAERHGARLRLVALCHHPLGLETGLAPAVSQRLIATERTALAHARAVIVTSPATASILTRDFAIPAAGITVAVPGTAPRPAAPCRGEPPVLLTVGSLIPRKGHDVLIEALSRLADRTWTARFVGSDTLDPAWAAHLRAKVEAAGLEPRIRFVGAVDDAARELHEADLFVLPSRFEGYGMAFAEALAAGLPIVAARAGAVPDVVPETAGILVPPDDPAALAGAIADLLGDRDRFDRCRAGSRAAGRALPTWEATAAIIATVLDREAT